MKRVVKSKYLKFACPHTSFWPHPQCAAIINKGSFSKANVWEAKKLLLLSQESHTDQSKKCNFKIKI